MNRIVLDCEWLQCRLPGTEAEAEAKVFEEIIQIGAVRVNDSCEVVETFSGFACPKYSRKETISWQLRKLFPFSLDRLNDAPEFPEAIGDFLRWCGPEPSFFIWGRDDVLILRRNLERYRMGNLLDGSELRTWDLQACYQVRLTGKENATALKQAAEEMGVELELPFHDAYNDAAYTAAIMRNMWERLGGLPGTTEGWKREFCAIEREQAERREQRRREKILTLRNPGASGSAAEQERPRRKRRGKAPKLEHYTYLGEFADLSECCAGPEVRKAYCPQCGKKVTLGPWYRLGKRKALARTRCPERHTVYATIFCRGSGNKPGRLEGFRRVFQAENHASLNYRSAVRKGEQILAR